jgi:peptidoglycan/LPS O-acetylase OafA/YrhL
MVTDRDLALDGLRAIAIIMVVVHNTGWVVGSVNGVLLKLWATIVAAGWVGVQLFFVLSGFLITRILLRSRHGHGWMRSFYTRRALRIFPLYYALLLFLYFIAPRFTAFQALGPWGNRSPLWYWFYLSNWMSPFGGAPSGLAHVWSLAVEEQFYFLWPAVIALMDEDALCLVCAAMIVGASIVRIGVHWLFSPDVAAACAYELTASRFDAIACGALVALAVRQDRLRGLLARRAWLVLSAASIALAMVVVAERGLLPRGLLTETIAQPLTALISAILVFICIGQQSVARAGERVRRSARTWLSANWLVTIGKYSYAIYVVHRLLYLVLRPHFLSLLTAGSGAQRVIMHAVFTSALFALSTIFAYVSWRVIEQPFLSLKRFVPMPAAHVR